MTGIKEYTAYFKNLAVNHAMINHSDKTSEKAFVRSNVDEMLTGFRTKLNSKGYVMRLLTPEWNPLDNNSSNIVKVMKCGLIISGYAKETEYDKQEQVMDVTEEIVEQIINRMHQDSKDDLMAEDDIFYKSLKTLSNINVYPEKDQNESRHGWLLTFNIAPFYNPCVDKNQWKDL